MAAAELLDGRHGCGAFVGVELAVAVLVEHFHGDPRLKLRRHVPAAEEDGRAAGGPGGEMSPAAAGHGGYGIAGNSLRQMLGIHGVEHRRHAHFVVGPFAPGDLAGRLAWVGRVVGGVVEVRDDVHCRSLGQLHRVLEREDPLPSEIPFRDGDERATRPIGQRGGYGHVMAQQVHVRGDAQERDIGGDREACRSSWRLWFGGIRRLKLSATAM